MTPHDDRLLLDVVVPVYDEEAALEPSISTLRAALIEHFGSRWRITIADNASTDATAAIADRLASALPGVVAVHLAAKGRGRALKQAWLDSPAEVVAYLDVDLSTELAALPVLIAPLLSGHSDLAIGTRLAPSSRVVRGAKREFVSRSYNAILRVAGVRASDAQCGFKAMRRAVAQRVLPHVTDTGWFFDTELLMIAERSGLRIHEVPVDWIDDPDSKVDVVATALADLRGVARVTSGILRGRIPVEAIYAELGRRPFEPPRRPGFFGQVVRFGIVGALSTLAFALLYLLLQNAMSSQAANFVALLVTAIANTGANRRFTFGVRGRSGLAGHQVRGLIVFGLAWALTAGALGLVHALDPDASATVELVALTGANLLATVLRFLALRWWVFRARRRRGVGQKDGARDDRGQSDTAQTDTAQTDTAQNGAAQSDTAQKQAVTAGKGMPA